MHPRRGAAGLGWHRDAASRVVVAAAMEGPSIGCGSAAMEGLSIGSGSEERMRVQGGERGEPLKLARHGVHDLAFGSSSLSLPCGDRGVGRRRHATHARHCGPRRSAQP
jgi:hypothetical protein